MPMQVRGGSHASSEAVDKKESKEIRVTMESQSTSSMEFLLLEEVQFLELKDDALFQWELVDVLEAFEEHDVRDANSVPNGFVSRDSSIAWSVSSPNNGRIHYHPDADVEDHDPRDVDHDDDVDDEGHGRQFCEDDEDDDDGYDLNDELVPWNVSNKLGRQRMRKLGKRVFSKMNNSKRSPFLFVSPGCVRGKHGLGRKHNY